jgi:hypothetical protein
MVEALNANNNETEVESRCCGLDHVGVMTTKMTTTTTLWSLVEFRVVGCSIFLQERRHLNLSL